MQKRIILIPLIGAALIGGAAVGVGFTAFAASSSSTTTAPTRQGGGMSFGAGASGTVTAINGDTLTVSGADGATYTIDASGATITKYANGASTTVGISGIAVGDTINVSGQIETATISAKSIRDGAPPAPAKPAAVGKVTAVNGTTITLSGFAMPSTKGTKPTTTTYTVDASNATITKITPPAAKGDKPTSATISASQVMVGDMLIVDGTANGSSITATTITDGAGFRGGVHGGFFGTRPQPQSNS